MHKVGNEDAGFSVDVDSVSRLVKVECWGFWDQPIAEAFDFKVIEACKQAPRGARVSMEMSRLKPMRDEGQRTFAHVITMLQQLALSGISIATTSHLTKLQLMRIARDAAPKGAVEFI